MGAANCLFERFSNMSAGFVLLFLGLGLLVVSFTVLPVVGLVLAVPVLIASIVFFIARRSKQCSL
ncbi:MAG: hypothetical protein PVF20_06400 [Desulfobacterales bacterium]|jgi:hypothetical protein